MPTTEAQVVHTAPPSRLLSKNNNFSFHCPHKKAPVLFRLARAQVDPALAGDQIFDTRGAGRPLVKYGSRTNPTSRLVLCAVWWQCDLGSGRLCMQPTILPLGIYLDIDLPFFFRHDLRFNISVRCIETFGSRRNAITHTQTQTHTP